MPICRNNPWRHPFRVPRIEKPRAEGRFHLTGGRRLGYAEYGDPSGPLVLWFHGTPGGRRQFPLLGRRAAEELGLRVVLVERPGSGLSDPHPYQAVADWAADMPRWPMPSAPSGWAWSVSPAAAPMPWPAPGRPRSPVG